MRSTTNEKPSGNPLSNLILLLITALLCLVAGEVILRLLERPEPANIIPRDAIIVSEEYHHDYRPNQEFTRYPRKADEFGPVHIKVNSLGIRGPEIHKKKGGEKRLLVIGDSFIQAEEIQFERTFGTILNNRLKMKGTTIVSHGISGWSPILELNWILKKGLYLKPDYILLVLCINDFYSLKSNAQADALYCKRASFDKKGFPTKFRIQKRTSTKKKVKKIQKKEHKLLLVRKFNSLLNNFDQKKIPQITQTELDNLLIIDNHEFLENKLENATKSLTPRIANYLKEIIRLSRPESKWKNDTIRTVNQCFSNIMNVKNICEQHNICLYISMSPLGWNISKDETYIGRAHYSLANCIVPMGGVENAVKEFCNRNKIEYIDIYKPFNQHKTSEENDSFLNKFFKNNNLFLRSDGHWSDKGHEVVANLIEEQILKKK